MERELELFEDSNYQIEVNYGMTLNEQLTCYYLTGTTKLVEVAFPLDAYTGASLTVKDNRNQRTVMTFSTNDNSITLPTTGSTFQLKKSAEEMSVARPGTYKYMMYISKADKPKRALISGDFIIKNNIS